MNLHEDQATALFARFGMPGLRASWPRVRRRRVPRPGSSVPLRWWSCVGIGGDPGFIDVIRLFEADPKTDAIIMAGEIGDSSDEEAGESIGASVKKPPLAYIAGVTAPPGTRMGHAGAIIDGGNGSADEKFAALGAAGVKTVPSPADLGAAMKSLPGGSKDKKAGRQRPAVHIAHS